MEVMEGRRPPVMAGGAAGSRSSRRQHHQHQHNAGTAPLLLLPPAPSPEDGARLVGSVHGLLPAGPLGPRFTLSATTGRAVLVVGGPLQSGSVKQEGEHAGADDNDASRKDKNNKADVEVDVGWLVGVLPSYLLTLITSRSPSSAVDRRAVIKGVEVLNALVASAGEVPSIAQTLATSASAFVDLLLCLLVWHVADYCEDQPRAADGEQKRDGVQDDAAPPPSPATDTASEVPAPATARCANGERSTAVGQAAATLSFALKAELLHPRPDGWEEGGFVDQPLLDAVLGHDKLDDIISAFIDSLRVLLHHYQHAPSPAVAEEICGVVEALYLLCFSDDFAGRLMGHRLFSEGHVLLALAQVLALPSAGEAMLASGLGLLAILCEKQQPEFLAIAHHQPPIHAIINTLLSLATSYLQKLGLQGKAEEEEGGGYAVASPAQAYADATYRRIFHCIELFADHPRYKAAIIRPGAEVLWCFLSLPTDAFGAFLKDPNRRAITVHLLHLLISLALPCPTASWEDITGGRAAQQGPALLVTALRDFCFSASPAQDREQAGERMVANLERVVGALYEADNIHFPVEHFLALHTLTAALHASLTATTLPAASTATATTTTAQTEDATSDSTAPPSATIAHQHAADPDEQAKQQQSEQVVKREEMEVNDEQTHREPDKQPHRAEEEGQAQHGQDKADGAVKEEDAEMLMAGEKKKKKEEPEKKETTIVEEGDEPRGEKRGREDVVSRPAADVDGGDDGTTTTTSNSARNEALPDDQQANGNSSDASNKMDEETTASAQQLQVEEMEEDEKEEGPSQKKLKLGHNAPAPNELPDDQQQQQQPNDQGQGEATPSDDHAPDTTTTTTNTE